MKFTNEQKQQITKAIVAAEKKTNGEIVPVIVRQSDLYPSAHFRSSLIMSFIALMTCYLIDELALEPVYFIYAFLAGTTLGYLLAYIPLIKTLLLTSGQMDEEFKQKAIESFLMNGATETQNRNGVQLYISAMEKRAMIISDIGIQKKLKNEIWQDIISEMTPLLKKGDYTAAIINAITSIGEILTEHFPDESKKEDELVNKLIIDL